MQIVLLGCLVLLFLLFFCKFEDEKSSLCKGEKAHQYLSRAHIFCHPVIRLEILPSWSTFILHPHVFVLRVLNPLWYWASLRSLTAIRFIDDRSKRLIITKECYSVSAIISQTLLGIVLFLLGYWAFDVLRSLSL